MEEGRPPAEAKKKELAGDVEEFLPEIGELRHSEKLLDDPMKYEKNVIPN